MGEKEQKKSGKTSMMIYGCLIALVAAIIIFAVMLHMEKSYLTAYEKGSIYVAKQRIPDGTVITEKNVTKYFEHKELDKTVIPDTAIRTPEQTLNLVSVYEIDKDTLLTTGMFDVLDEIKAEMKHPVIAGLKAEDMYQVVGGTLRPGDRIDIYKIDEMDEATLIWGDVYVLQVFDNSGKTIETGDTTTAAQRMNIYLESEEVEHFYAELVKGSLRVVKVCE